MRIDLTGKTALVTGSTQGIGRAISATLADAGARVAINGRRAEGVAATIDLLRAESLDRELVAVRLIRSTLPGITARGCAVATSVPTGTEPIDPVDLVGERASLAISPQVPRNVPRPRASC